MDNTNTIIEENLETKAEMGDQKIVTQVEEDTRAEVILDHGVKIPKEEDTEETIEVHRTEVHHPADPFSAVL